MSPEGRSTILPSLHLSSVECQKSNHQPGKPHQLRVLHLKSFMVMICGPSNVVNLPSSPWAGKRVLGPIPEGEQTDKKHRNHTMICDQILLIMNIATRYLRLFQGTPSSDKAVKASRGTQSRQRRKFPQA